MLHTCLFNRESESVFALVCDKGTTAEPCAANAEWSIALPGSQLPLGSRLTDEVFDLTLLRLPTVSSRIGHTLAFDEDLGCG